VFTFLAKLLLGSGTLQPELRAELESEGLVLIEEGLGGSVRYRHFKAPGRRFHGKVTGERMGLGISNERFVVYCRSGKVKLLDSAFTSPRLGALDVSLRDDDTLAIGVDYDQMDEPDVAGQITIVAHSPNAASIVSQLNARLARG
jgi:hypothetical protein